MLKHPSSIKTEQTTSENISCLKKKNPSTDYPQTLLVSNKPKEPADDSFFGATKLEHGQRVWWSAYRSPSLLGPSLAQP